MGERGSGFDPTRELKKGPDHAKLMEAYANLRMNIFKSGLDHTIQIPLREHLEAIEEALHNADPANADNPWRKSR